MRFENWFYRPRNVIHILNFAIMSIFTSSQHTWWMIPLPGFQNPIPNMLADWAKKSYTSALTSLAVARSVLAPTSAVMRWSQCIVVGTATRGRPLEMNCSVAIWAVASCIATLSGLNWRYDSPLTTSYRISGYNLWVKDQLQSTEIGQIFCIM